MNLLNHIGTETLPDGLVVVRPFTFIRVPEGDTENTFKVIPIWLQFDNADTVGRHGEGRLSHWMDLPIYRPTKYRVLYLARAVVNKLDDVKVEAPYFNGTMWGWFPKEMAV